MIGPQRRQRPHVLVRLLATAALIGVVWYVITYLFSFFGHSMDASAAARLIVRSPKAVEVSLQKSPWQEAESNLKLDAGDRIATRAKGDALLTFFDGTRIRLAEETEITIESNERSGGDTSHVKVRLNSGRLWVSTPATSTLSGSILRTIATADFSTTVPDSAHVLISPTIIAAISAANLGARTSFTIAENRRIPEIYIGEGQYFQFDGEARLAITSGTDPYAFRDPMTQQLLKDAFLVSSYALLSSAQAPSLATDSAETSIGDQKLLLVTSPAQRQSITENIAKVTGRVGDRIQTVLVNGQIVNIGRDKTFDVDVSVVNIGMMTISVEARDEQGIVLATEERVIERKAEFIAVEPVRIKSPGGSGDTITVQTSDVDLSGEAPPSTNAIVVNDYRLQLYRSGSKTWSYLASTSLGNLKPGENHYTIYALDADGNRSPGRSITIVLVPPAETGTGSIDQQQSLKQNAPLTPGILTVDLPESGTEATVTEREVVIEGRTSAETATLSVNGYSLALYSAGKTTWNYRASTALSTMKRGKNVYRIVARNRKGEILDVLEYTLTFRP